jgi:transposase-like protein
MSQTPVRKRRVFDETFKREAVSHWICSGKSAVTVAAELGVHVNRLYMWKRQYQPADAGGRASAAAKPAKLAQAQLEAAQREIRHLKEQRDILKKTLGILSEPPANATNGSTR